MRHGREAGNILGVRENSFVIHSRCLTKNMHRFLVNVWIEGFRGEFAAVFFLEAGA